MRKNLLLVCDRLDDGMGEGLAGIGIRARRSHRYMNKLLRIMYREPTHHESVDQTEDRGVRSDSKREGKQSCRRESAIAPHRAERIPDVAVQLLEPHEGPHRPGLLRDSRDVSQLAGLGHCCEGFQFLAHLSFLCPSMRR